MASTGEAFDLVRFQFIANIKMSANPTNGFPDNFKSNLATNLFFVLWNNQHSPIFKIRLNVCSLVKIETITWLSARMQRILCEMQVALYTLGGGIKTSFLASPNAKKVMLVTELLSH